MFLWYLSRATGIAALAMFTVVLVLGMVLSGQRKLTPGGQAVAIGVHRSLSLGSVVFLVLHIVTAVLDTFAHVGWLAMVVPFTSGYERTWISLGTLSVDVALAVIVTSLLRARISRNVWRWVHLTSYLSWVVAVVHSYALGTSDEPVLRAITVACAGVGLAVIVWRAFATHPDAAQRRLARAKEWA